MRQVLQDRSGLTTVRSVPHPPCPAGGVLVRNEFSVISAGTERARLALSKKSLLGKAVERPDLVRQVVQRATREGLRSTARSVRQRLTGETAVGYSSAGVVIEIGRRVSGLDVGDRVACCGAGYANHAEIVAVPRNMVVKVPHGVPMSSAAMSTIAAIALHGIHLGHVEVGHRVAVIGCGLVGQLACRLLTAAGAEVFALDVEEGRVDRAVAGGADHGIRPDGNATARVLSLTSGVGVDVALVTAAAATSAPLRTATSITRDRGSVVLIGAVPVDLPRSDLYDKELRLRISRSYGPGRYDPEYEERGLDYPIGYVRWTEQRNIEAVLALQARGRLHLDDLVDEVIPVEDAARAYSLLTETAHLRPAGAIVLSYEVVTPSHKTIEPKQRPLTSANDGALRIGLIGPGSFATRVLVPAFQAAGVRMAIVGGGSGRSAEAAGRSLGFARIADDEAAVIKDAESDIVVIATRHGTHADLTKRALESGKHVFCEKPLAINAVELEDVLNAAREAEGQLLVGFNRRYSPLLMRMRAFLIDQVTPFTAAYRVSAGQIEGTSWVHDLDQGGGRAIGEACHFIDTLSYIVGHPVVAVHAFGHGDSHAPMQARDNLIISLSFSDASAATIIYSAAGSPRVAKERIEVFRGSRTAVLDDYHVLELYGPSGKHTVRSRSQDKGHQEEVADFVAGIRSGRVSMPLAGIANVSRASIAVIESLTTGRPVTI